jgi:DNA-binding CsgD family transcriptional regulator
MQLQATRRRSRFAVVATGVHEVWARAAWALVDLSRELGVTPDSLLVDVGFDNAELRRRRRIPWTEYCAIIERVAQVAGGPEELEDLGANAYHQVVPELRAFAGKLVSPRAFLWFVLDVVDPLLFPPVEFACEDLGTDRVRVSAVLRPGARPCEAYFRGSMGALRGLPAHLGLPMAEVECRELAPDRGICDVRLPASRTLVRRARSAMSRLVLGADPDGAEIAATFGMISGSDPTEQRLARATSMWQLTQRQREVLEHVVAGRANKEIAKELGCADNTIELHVTRLFRKAEVSSRAQLIARFWSPEWGFPH